MRREAPFPGEIEAVLQNVRVRLAVKDDKREAGGVQEELHEQLLLCDGVVSNNWQESWFADHEVAPQRNHSSSGVCKGWAREKNMLEITLLVRASRKSEESIQVVFCPVLREKVSPVSARKHSCSNHSFAHFKWTASMGPDWMGVRETCRLV